MKKEDGSIVVETIFSFILYFFLMMSILSIVNIVTVQARVHYAITQAANTVSMYSYILDVTGADGVLQTSSNKASELNADAAEVVDNVNVIIDELSSFQTSNIESTLEETGDTLSKYVEDPTYFFSMLVNYALDEGKKALFAEAMQSLVGRYLANGDMSGDEYLKAFGVIDGLEGLQFGDFSIIDNVNGIENDSYLLDGKGDVKIVVTYKIDYTFGALPLPFDELEITQVVKTKAWLGGEGEGYTK